MSEALAWALIVFTVICFAIPATMILAVALGFLAAITHAVYRAAYALTMFRISEKIARVNPNLARRKWSSSNGEGSNKTKE